MGELLSRLFAEKILAKLACGSNLSESESAQIFNRLFRDGLSRQDAKALVLLLAAKGETVDEIAGCYKAIRKLEPEQPVSIPGLMDTCGTGGDASQSFNISTLAAFVIAGAGGKVAKHGNRAITSRSGSSDLMEALGVRLNAPRRRMIESIRQCGIGYFHAPFYHPVFSRVQDLRKEIKVRTIFNLMGPLLNPLKIKHQLLGIGGDREFELYPKLFKKLGYHDVLICRSRDGMDEITTSDVTRLVFLKNRQQKKEQFNPAAYGFRRAKKGDYSGGNPKQNARTALALLKNQQAGPLRDVVLVNAAAGLAASGVVKNMRQGIVLAELALMSGRAYRALQGLIQWSRKS